MDCNTGVAVSTHWSWSQAHTAAAALNRAADTVTPEESEHVDRHLMPAEPCCGCRGRVEQLEDVLRAAEMQIEYLHSKWRETFSGNAVLARIRAALTGNE